MNLTSTKVAHLIDEVSDEYRPAMDGIYDDDGETLVEPEDSCFLREGKEVFPTFILPCLHDIFGTEDTVIRAMREGAKHGLTPQQTLEVWSRAGFLQASVVVE
jgi:hypothetical protein